MALPVIPPELVDHCIKYLHAHTSSLRACTLVSSVWLPFARTQLFSSISVIDDHLTQDFLAFRIFLESSPAICACIRDVCLQGCTAEQARAGYRPDVDSQSLHRLLDLLPRLRSVSIYHLRCTAAGGLDQQQLQAPKCGLTALDIHDVHFEIPPIDFFRRFSEFLALHLFRVSWPDIVGPCTPQPISVKALGFASTSHFMKSFVKQFPTEPEALRMALFLDEVIMNAPGHLSGIFPEARKSVQELLIGIPHSRLYFPNPGQSSMVQPRIRRAFNQHLRPVSEMSHLRSFTFTIVRPHSSQQPHTQVWPLFLDLLFLLPKSVHSVTLIVHTSERNMQNSNNGSDAWPHGTIPTDWERMLEGLERLSELKSLRIFENHVLPDGRFSVEEWKEKEVIENALDKLKQRGVEIRVMSYGRGDWGVRECYARTEGERRDREARVQNN